MEYIAQNVSNICHAISCFIMSVIYEVTEITYLVE